MKKLILVVVAVLLTACQARGPVFDRGETFRPSSNEFATVVGVRQVAIKQSGQGSGATYVIAGIGGMVGGVLGSKAGNGRGSSAAIGSAVGAAAGTALGAAAGSSMADSTVPGLEIIVKRADGRVDSVIQPATREVFSKGQPVRLVQTNMGMHVAPIQ